ncbi:hypothetical protein [Rhizobium sp. SG2393]|uniref:hypothetical protein n=1 Tax=Rhizobium sp. SG2393 TaxID=3276279 RepID=UPI0036723CC9
MNEHVRPDKDRRDRLAAEEVRTTIDPVTGAPIDRRIPGDTAQRPVENNVYNAVETRPGRSGWPILVVLAAGLILALIAWYPAEVATQSDTATQPAATDTQSTTTTPPAASTDNGTVPSTGAQPTTTPPATNDAAQPTTGTTPQDTAPTTTTPPASTTEPTTGTTPTDTAPATSGQGQPLSNGQ